MPTREEWLAAIKRLDQAGRVADLDLELMSPQFTHGNWRIGPEHQRKFTSIVLRWIPDPRNPPFRRPEWETCPESDQYKNWSYRVKLHPADLETLLDQLDTEHPFRIVNLKQIVRRANKLADPRCIFYQAILESSSKEQYLAKVGDIIVVPPTHQKPMGARIEYRYMLDNRNWIEEIPEEVTQYSFTPDPERDARQRVLRELCARQGQVRFRHELLKIYGSRCAITGCGLEHVLEAAHITPYLGPHTNELPNGLLLRADIHTLWDKGLVAADEKTRRVWIHPALRNGDPEYFESIDGKTLLEPEPSRYRPSAEALQSHWRFCHGE
ncbi:MAG: HNH endonuclease [Rhodocyclaceae bacterium]|nr:HNH endonuclease [Rhodocyclaceae bacterium]